MVCHPVGSPPSVLVLLHSTDTRLWSIGIGLGCLAILIAGFFLWRFLPDTNPMRRPKVLVLYVIVLWCMLFGLWLIEGVTAPWQQALDAWGNQSLQNLGAHNCSLAAYNALATQSYHADTTVELLMSLLALGGGLTVGICAVAMDPRRTRMAVRQSMTGMLAMASSYVALVKWWGRHLHR
jgi:hypothetical protein